VNVEALKDLLYKMADDLLIIGHRNSEWTGLGPMLEEDIAFSSMAQDKIGQSYLFYQMLHELGESDPDTVAFMRNSDQFHNSQMVELPNGEYDFSLVRHFLYDYADLTRFELLTESSIGPLSDACKKFKGELRYHTMHAKSFITKLGNANDESISRLQQSLDDLMPYALGIFEPSKFESDIISEGMFAGEDKCQSIWMERISEIIDQTELKLSTDNIEPVFGGRYGTHTEHLQPLLDEMSEVFSTDPSAEW
jgi:ring-1,2-phenylacetyl-CoA epoxidase subunit PaaC